MCVGAHESSVLLLPGHRATIESVRGAVSFGTFDDHSYNNDGDFMASVRIAEL